MNDLKNFERESLENIKKIGEDQSLKELSNEWILKTNPYKYAYNWRWQGLPIIQFPQDIVVTQEIIWSVKPTVIIETGIARGGSLTFAASQLALLDLSEYGKSDIENPRRKVIGIDIDIRPHNREVIEKHPFYNYMELIEGSSTDKSTFNLLTSHLESDDTVLVILDSNHTHDHVLKELNLYAPLVSKGSYIITHDTGIEFVPKEIFDDRNWGPGNNPLTAVHKFLENNKNFEVDHIINSKLLITSSPQGYIKRIL